MEKSLNVTKVNVLKPVTDHIHMAAIYAQCENGVERISKQQHIANVNVSQR